MVTRPKRLTEGEIRKAVEQVVRQFHPQKVILFGSYAHGMPAGDSDVDLLVVMETDQRSVEQAVAIRQAVDFPFPIDLLVRTPGQIEERLRLGDLFIQGSLRQGKVLYEADHERMGGQG